MSSSALESNVLVLNRFYQVIRVINVRRSLTILYRGCAEVLTLDSGRYNCFHFEEWCELSRLTSLDKQPGDEYLQVVGFELQVPRIIRLTLFDRIPVQGVQFSRKNLFARDGHLCQYCGQAKPTNQLSLDHVIPRSHGGNTSWENVVCCCVPCNGRKGGRTPNQAKMKLLKQPARPRHHSFLIDAISDPRYECWKTFLPASH